MNLRQPVVLTLIAAVILVLVGLYFVERQRMVSPSNEATTWGSAAGYIEPSASPSQTVTEEIPLPNAISDNNPETLVIPHATATPRATKTPSTEGTFDFNAMLAQMKREGAAYQGTQASGTFTSFFDSLSIAPTLSAPTDGAPARTPEQEALFAYGNRIGAYIQGFAAVNINMTETLTGQIKHRDDKQFGDPVRVLGDRYSALGESILALHDVPTSMEQAHAALGQSYVDLGKALRAVPDATDDRSYLAAITAYNNKADAFTRAYVGMVNMFTTFKVSFGPSDAGSAFMFQHN